MSVSISKFEIENVKRVKVVKVKPDATGLTILGGDNGQGKTSVLDAIAYALGGEKYRPSKFSREGSANPGTIKIVMSNGLVVERKGKNAALKVTDPSGQKAGQTLLDSFVSTLALDLPKFLEASSKEKANTLLKIIGVGDQLAAMDMKEKELFSERTVTGRTADTKAKFAENQPYYPDAPKELISASELIQKQQDILARNAQRQQWQRDHDALIDKSMRIDDQIEQLQQRILALKQDKQTIMEQVRAGEKTPAEMKMESTAELEQNLAQIDEINRKVRANLDKERAEEDAKGYREAYDQLTVKIGEIREARKKLLDNADLPLPGLTIEDGELIYQGQKWDNMSGSQRLIVSTAIVRKLNPECGFVLMDKLEQMDLHTLKEFGTWLEQEGLQVIATRVSTGDECSIIIEDGTGISAGYEETVEAAPAAPKPMAGRWKIGGNK